MSYRYKPDGREPEPRTCAKCGKSYTPKVVNAKYCSIDCRLTANYHKRKRDLSDFKTKHPDYWSEYYKRRREANKKYKFERVVKHGHACKCKICHKKYHGYSDMCPKCQTRRRDRINPDCMLMMW